MADPTMTFAVTRYRPPDDTAPVTQTYTIPYNEDWVVLDALNGQMLAELMRRPVRLRRRKQRGRMRNDGDADVVVVDEILGVFASTGSASRRSAHPRRWPAAPRTN